MEGLEVGERFDTMGLRGNDLRRLYFKDVRVPAENVLGEPGEGFRVAMQILNNGRIGLGTGSVGAAKQLLDLTIDHVKERRQFGQPLADFELVQDKIGWMVSYLFGLESMSYLTCGLVDAGRPRLLAGVRDLQGLRDRVPLVRRQPLAAARRRPGLPAHASPGRRSCATSASSRSSRAPTTCCAPSSRSAASSRVGEKLEGLGDIGLDDPIGSIGVLVDYVADRVQREVRPDKIDAGPRGALRRTPTPSPTRSSSSRGVTEKLLREHKQGGRSSASSSRSGSPTRSPTSTPRSRSSPGSARSSRTRASSPRARSATSPTPSATRAAARVGSNFDQIESNDDERMTAIAKLAYKRGEYGYALFED